MVGQAVHFSKGLTLIRGQLVEDIHSGVVISRIDLDGGRKQGWTVQVTDGDVHVVTSADIRKVTR